MTVDTHTTLKIIEHAPTVCNTGGCDRPPAADTEHCDRCLRLHQQIRQAVTARVQWEHEQARATGQRYRSRRGARV